MEKQSYHSMPVMSFNCNMMREMIIRSNRTAIVTFSTCFNGSLIRSLFYGYGGCQGEGSKQREETARGRCAEAATGCRAEAALRENSFRGRAAPRGGIGGGRAAREGSF